MSAGTEWPAPGTCPSCGSGDVHVLAYGMRLPEEMATAPPYVWFMGCVVDGPEDRHCLRCRHRWAAAPA